MARCECFAAIRLSGMGSADPRGRSSLYAAKSGEELVKEQSFVFTDRGGDTITLRPELTPSLARMGGAEATRTAKPIRVVVVCPSGATSVRRKGAPASSSKWNIDLLRCRFSVCGRGTGHVLVEFFRSVGLSATQVVIKVNNRKLMEAQIKALGLEADKIDGVYKLNRQTRQNYQRTSGARMAPKTSA